MKIPLNKLSENHSFSASAPDMGWEFGHWPPQIEIDRHGTFTFDNYAPKIGATYKQKGSIVKVFVFEFSLESLCR